MLKGVHAQSLEPEKIEALIHFIKEDLGFQLHRALQKVGCVDSLLSSSGVHPKNIDMVFLTGGSSFVRAVRKIFEARFGEKRIRGGNEFTSVARGLALKATDSRIFPYSSSVRH